MTNRTVEAILKISAKMGDMKALKTLQNELRKIDTQAKSYNRAQSVVYSQLRKTAETHATVMRTMRFAAPAAIGYGAKQSFQQFADLERQLTRTGLKLGATRKDMDALKSTAQSTAQRYAVANAAVYETIDAYAETGAELKDIKSDIDTIVKAQQAMGAEGRDVVGSWDAARKNFGVMSGEAERFYDILAKGSATGKFEGSDLAKHLPSLLPIAGVQGMSGLSGTAQVVGALEAMRDRTGTSETAATAMTDFLDKLNSPDVQKNFKKVNIDLPKAMKEARESGDDFFTGMSKILNRATRGDVAKLGMIFGERDSRNFARLLMQDIDDVEERIRVLREQSKGTITFNVKAVTENAQASIDRLSNGWNNFLNSTGSLLDGLGASNRLQAVATDFDRLNGALKGGWTPADSLLALATGGSPTAVVNDAAWKGGYRSPEQLSQIEAYKAFAQSKTEGVAGRDPTYGVGLGSDGVPFPVPYSKAGSGDPANAIPFFTDAGLRDVPPDLMTRRDKAARIGKILDADSGAASDANYEEFQRAVSQGGDDLQKSGQAAGGTLEDAASRAAQTLVNAANQLAQKLSNISVTIKQAAGVNADTGRAGADVDAGGPN